MDIVLGSCWRIRFNVKFYV